MKPLARRAMGLFLVGAGVAVELVALGIIPFDAQRIHAPMWVLSLSGVLFLAGGFTVLAPPGSGLAIWCGGAVVVSITAVSAWVALYGPEEGFSGGLPWIPRELDLLIARLMFGCVALLGLAIMAGAAAGLRRGR